MTAETEVAHADVARLIELDERIRNIKAQRDQLDHLIRGLQEERGIYESNVLETWIDAGTSQMKQDGHTVSLRCDRWPKVREEHKSEAPFAFIRAGLSYLLSVNSTALRSYALNMIDRKEALPEEIADLIEVTENYSLRTTPSKKHSD